MSQERRVPIYLSALVLIAHGPALFSSPPPVDQGFLQANALLKLPWSEFFRGLLWRRYFVLSSEATYQPLVTVFHYFLLGAPRFFHALVLCVHALNAALMFALAKRLGLGEKTSVLAATLFAVFPPATEAVAVPSFAGHVFGLAAALSCVICWLNAQEGRNDSARRLAGAYVAFALGLLFKESVMLTPAFLVLCLACDPLPAPWRQAVKGLAGLWVLAIFYLLWRFFALIPSPAVPPAHRGDWLLSLGWYARMLIWPWPLCFEHARLAPGLTLFAGLFVLAGLAVVLRPGLLLGYAWIVLGLLPYLHVIPFVHGSPVADRYLYFAVPGFCLLLGRLLDSRRGRLGLVALALIWCGLTFKRSMLFADPDATCEQTASCAPDSTSAQIMAGNALLASGKYAQAKEAFFLAAGLDPSQPVAWSNLGIASCMLGDYDGGIKAFEKALNLGDFPAVRSNLAAALEEKRKASTSTSAPKRRAGPSLP